jgi:hypothetical protein
MLCFQVECSTAEEVMAAFKSGVANKVSVCVCIAETALPLRKVSVSVHSTQDQLWACTFACCAAAVKTMFSPACWHINCRSWRPIA